MIAPLDPGNTSQKADVRESGLFALAYGVVAIAAFQCGLGTYAMALNKLFYATFGPFYDSMSYLNALARLQAMAHAKGWVAAFLETSFHSTVVLPWLLFTPFAKSAAFTRTNAVWIQIMPLATMQFMLFLYFFRTRALPFILAFSYSTVFCLIAAVFRFNGGLADFRMDLLQYVLLTTVMASYFIARESRGLAWWIALGFFSGALCLGRATSPVYIVPIFAILALADLAGDIANWRPTVLRWAIVGIVTAIVAGWFFIGNFDHLYFYYFIWNPDAHAHLPLMRSALHAGFVIKHLGVPLALALIAVALITAAIEWRQFGSVRWRRVNWRALVFSAVPVGYLVLSGSGLNQFVSIVGSAGVIMFLLDPGDGVRPRFSPLAALVAIALLGIACGINVSQGVANYSRTDRVSSWIPRQVGLRRIVELMVETVQHDNKRRSYTYFVAHIGSLANATMFNALVYDQGFLPVSGAAVVRDGVRLEIAPQAYHTSTAARWAKVPGRNDDEKVSKIVADYAEHVDFLFVPTAETELPRHVYGSRIIPEVRRRILASPIWEQIGGPIRMSLIEGVMLVKNRSRIPTR
jgi:hypothetical protein